MRQKAMTSENTPAQTTDLLILIPAFNEAQRVAPVIAGALPHGPVLVVDDGSADETVAVAEAAGAAVLRQPENQGKGAALRAGFRQALDAGCAAIITLDADGQHDPAEIPAFLAAWRETQADLIIGERSFRQMPWLRRVANLLGYWSFSWAVGRNVRDNQSGYRLLSQRMMAAVLDSDEDGFEFEVEAIVTCVRRRYRLEHVPIRTIYGDEPSHIDNREHLTNFIRLLWRTRRAVPRDLRRRDWRRPVDA
jgi:glycosyltransferase involved in cell wall biosynthesis